MNEGTTTLRFTKETMLRWTLLKAEDQVEQGRLIPWAEWIEQLLELRRLNRRRSAAKVA